MKRIEFSVLISLYNNEKEENLEAALRSLKDQTLKANEVIIVLDGPIRAALQAVLDDYQVYFDCFHVLPLKENVGLGNALNYGLGFCKYEYVARMDTDDICYPERFQVQIAKLQENLNISALGCAIQEFNCVPNDLNRFKIPPSSSTEVREFALYRNPLNHPTVIFKKADVLLVGSYQDMPLFEDYYLWIRLLSENFIIENISEPLLHFRIGNKMLKRRHGLQYVKKEIKFLRAIKMLQFIKPYQMYFSILLKSPLRLIPLKAFELVYKIFLR
jgi:glycosyltransferase involved in cell wall biosynthesis